VFYKIEKPSKIVVLDMNKYLRIKKIETTNLNQNLASHFKLEKLKHIVQDAFPGNSAKNLLRLK